MTPGCLHAPDALPARGGGQPDLLRDIGERAASRPLDQAEDRAVDAIQFGRRPAGGEIVAHPGADSRLRAVRVQICGPQGNPAA